MAWGNWGIWLGALFVGYFILRLLAEPLRYLFLILGRGVLGYAALWVLNGAGLLIGLRLPLNPFTALVAGILGVPGTVVIWVVNRLYT